MSDEIVLNHMARVGYDRMFEEKWMSLHPGSIERKLWTEIARVMLKEARRWKAVKPAAGGGEKP